MKKQISPRAFSCDVTAITYDLYLKIAKGNFFVYYSEWDIEQRILSKLSTVRRLSETQAN